MKKIVLCFIFFTFVVVNTYAETISITVYADDEYPPYSYQENGTMKGIYTEILNEIFPKMKKYDIKIKGVPWKRGLGFLKSGKGFALYPPYRNEKDRPYMDYSLPILEEKVVVFLSEKFYKNNPTPKWPNDFHNFKVGKNLGFNLGIPELNMPANQGKIKVIEAKGNRTNLILLSLEKIDAYANDRISILWLWKKLWKEIKDMDYKNEYKKIYEGPFILKQDGYLGLTNKNDKGFPFKTDFTNEFNKHLKEMKKSEKIKSIVSKYVD